jgi:hypothetical protein
LTEYLFKMARLYELPFAFERASFADDQAALAHAETMAGRHPLAATVTVAIEPRTIGRVPVRFQPGPDRGTATAIRGSRELIAAARALLAETEPEPEPDAPPASPERAGDRTG